MQPSVARRGYEDPRNALQQPSTPYAARERCIKPHFPTVIWGDWSVISQGSHAPELPSAAGQNACPL